MDDSKQWLVIFFAVIAFGAIIIFVNLLIPDGTVFPTGIGYALQNGYRLLSILLGVLAGTALGELFKIRSNNKAGRMLLSDLIEELKVNLISIESGVPLRKGFWILGIRSGKAQYLSKQERRNLWEIYSRITHYNEDLQHLHRIQMLDDSQSSTEIQSEIQNLCTEITERIESFLVKEK